MGISIFAGEAEEGRLDEILQRRLERHAEAALQLHGRPAGHRGRADAPPAAGRAGPQRRPQVELRSRPRLPVPVLVLHHHQRAGPQEPLPQRRRPRGDRPRELQAGHHVVLHHRRQHGPQQALGRLLRPADRAQGERRHRGLPDHPGRHPVPSHPELHPQGALGRRLPRVHRARERQPRQPAGRQEAPEQDHRIPQDAAGLAHQRAPRPGRATSWVSPATRASRSCATWRSSRRSCRSTSSSCSC